MKNESTLTDPYTFIYESIYFNPTFKKGGKDGKSGPPLKGRCRFVKHIVNKHDWWWELVSKIFQDTHILSSEGLPMSNLKNYLEYYRKKYWDSNNKKNHFWYGLENLNLFISLNTSLKVLL